MINYRSNYLQDVQKDIQVGKTMSIEEKVKRYKERENSIKNDIIKMAKEHK